MKLLKRLKEIKGDASFRRFFRNKKNKTIIIYANKEKNKNLLIYDAINKILIKNKVLAPKLLSQNYHKNFIEIQDLGTKTIYQLLKKKNINSYSILKKVVKILNKVQLIKDKKIKNFKNKLYKIPEYHNHVLYNEAKIFCDWYVPKKLSKKISVKFNYQLKKEVKSILTKLNYNNDTFVHRDFHVSNLMYLDNKIGVIDSQDALIGNKAYDLASLIDDVRFKTSNKLKKKIYDYYLKKNNKIKAKKFKIDFDILSVLRNLKIIGIFMRLATRDNKKKYLKLIPYAWEMIDYRISQNKVFDNLRLLLNNNFSNFIG